MECRSRFRHPWKPQPHELGCSGSIKMKLLFSEQTSDYKHYQFGYAIWAIPEAGEKPSDLFNAGFLPSSRELDRFYLCRQIRVKLPGFALSSENRRILRKGEGVSVELVPREKFDYTP